MSRMKVLALASVLVLGSVAITLAQTTTTTVVTCPEGVVCVGNWLDELLKIYLPVLGTVVSILVAWAAKKWLGVTLDTRAREAIDTTATNLAGMLLAKVDDIKQLGNIDIHNRLIAQVANDGLNRAKDSLDRFGLDVDHLKQRIVEKIGVLTAPAVAVPPPEVVVVPPTNPAPVR